MTRKLFGALLLVVGLAALAGELWELPWSRWSTGALVVIVILWSAFEATASERR